MLARVSYNGLWGLVFDVEDALTSFKFTHLIKFFSLLLRIMLPKVYQYICTFEKIADVTAFNTQLQCISSASAGT